MTEFAQGAHDLMRTIETAVEGLGYAFVEAVWVGGGLLRVTIDRTDDAALNVDDCERVSRQLQYALEVDGVDYHRLEVSSPGLDRLLRTPQDFQRFAGELVDVTLRAPFQGRKKYRGVLQQPLEGDATQAVVWDEALLAELAASKPGAKKPAPRKVGVAKPAAPSRVAHELRFSMAEVREVRLVPVIDFRGRKS
ncbi:ribosome maturation factor RimP [mine drainage metagenome]|uniref:Ribosome maturation factor RimP n=1 Tax=mine drainage metagenome TaxID=410659 RepID=A0A1J5QNX8_9ZZZZ